MKIALVHDYLVQYGGAERVLECFMEMFPNAPIYTLVYDEEATHSRFSQRKVHTSFLQKFPFSKRRHRIFPPLMPTAIEQFDFSSYDVVLSDSSSYAKGVITRPETVHICYMHTPMRYAWDDCQRYAQDFYFPSIVKKIIPFAMNAIRLWDKISVDRIDHIIANSTFVAERIKKYYRKDACVIHPPVSTDDYYVSARRKNYFLMVGRLIAYKRHDIVIRAFNRLGLNLKIIGRGPELNRLQALARPNVEFLGHVEDVDLARYYSECKAFIFPQEEDFGIVAIEALASGRPVIAYRGGEFPRHIEEGVSGVFFENQTPKDVFDAVRKFDSLKFDENRIREDALPFDKERFKDTMRKYIDDVLVTHRMRMTENVR